jgi:hypothetical protein
MTTAEVRAALDAHDAEDAARDQALSDTGRSLGAALRRVGELEADVEALRDEIARLAPKPEPGAKPLGTTGPALPSPIPSTYRFVDPVNGSDANDGSQVKPWKTWAKAHGSALSGSTVVIADGTLHERFAVTKILTVQAAPGAVVWFDGSTPLTGLKANGDGTWSAPYALTYPRTATAFKAWDETSPEGKYRHYADQAWIDGTPLVQVADATKPGPGQFSVDQTNDRITIGSDPMGREVRVADLSGATITARVTVTGVGFRRYACKTPTNVGADGWAFLFLGGYANGSSFTDCVFEQSNLCALSSIRPITLRRITVQDMGMSGIMLEKADGSLLEDVLVRRYNRGRWNAEPVCAAVKVARTNGITFTRPVVEDGPGAYGLWGDINVTRPEVTDPNIVGNTGLAATLGNDMERGIEFELSGGGLFDGVQHRGSIRGGKVTGCEVGIMLFNADHIDVTDMDLAGNDAPVMVWQDARADRDLYRTPTEVPWKSFGNTVEGCRLVVGGMTSAYKAAIVCEDMTGGAGVDLLPDLDGNTFGPGTVAALGVAGTTRRTRYDLAGLMKVAGVKVAATNTQAS